VARLSWHRNLTAWVFVPVGVLLVLLACFGVNSLIGLSSVSFPASVACLIVLFLSLIVLDMIVGDRKTRAIVNIIDIPVSIFFILHKNLLTICCEGWLCSSMDKYLLHTLVYLPSVSPSNL
jgi:hypothetical protein